MVWKASLVTGSSCCTMLTVEATRPQDVTETRLRPATRRSHSSTLCICGPRSCASEPSEMP